MKKAVQFGAGNIGRGLMGDILFESGYALTFVDVNAGIQTQINQTHSYDLYFIDHNYEKKTITNAQVLSSIDEPEKVLEAIAEADLITTSVWANNLSKIAPLLAKGLHKRLETGAEKINVLACENAMFASSMLRAEIIKTAVFASDAQLDAIACFPNTAVDRVVIGNTMHGMQVVNVADYHELAVEKNALVDAAQKPVKHAKYTDNLQKFLERKLYVINCGHAFAGYLGYIYGFDSVYDVFMNAEMVAQVKRVMQESATLIAEKYDFSKAEMDAYVDFGIARYQTKGVDYSVSMVTRAPIRKLGATDRLVGPCVQCEERGLANQYLLKGIALVLLCDREDDAEAVQLQACIRAQGLENTIAQICGLKKGGRLMQCILKDFNALKQLRDDRRLESEGVKGALQKA